MCWGTLVAAEFLAGTTGIGFVENVAKKYFQYEVIWITIFIMGMLGLLFDVTLRKIIDKTIPWRGKRIIFLIIFFSSIAQADEIKLTKIMKKK